VDADLRRLRSGELIAGAGAILLLVSMFLDWYGVSLSTVSLGSFQLPHASTNAWDSFTVVDILLALTIASGLTLVWSQATRRSPAVPVAFSVLSTVLAILSALVTLWRIVDPPAIDLPGRLGAIVAPHLSRTVEVGAWIGLLATVVTAVGAWRSLRQEGVAPEDERTSIETVALRGAIYNRPG
jgi:cytochrome bd-type quinol oxidase subunit 2